MSPWKQRLGCSDLFETSFTKDSRTAKANFSLYFCLIPLSCKFATGLCSKLDISCFIFFVLLSWTPDIGHSTPWTSKGPAVDCILLGTLYLQNSLLIASLTLEKFSFDHWNQLSISKFVTSQGCMLQEELLDWTTPWNSLDHFRQSECFWSCPGPRCWVWPQWLTIVFQPLANTVVTSAHLGSQPVLGRAIGLRHKYTRAGSHCLWPVSPCQPFSAPRPTLYLPTI